MKCGQYLSLQLMQNPQKTTRKACLDKIRSSIKALPVLTSKRQALESKAEKRRARRQSIRMNPDDFDAFNEEKKSVQEMGKEKKMEKFNEKFEFLEKIGEGTFGVVKKCRHKQKNKIYAVKCMGLNEEHLMFLKKNFKFIRRLDHPNIIKYRSLYLDIPKSTCYLVMDYETMPSLQKVKNLTEEEVRGIMKQLFDVLFYLHSRHICHRDIKPDNILYDSNTRKIKLIDFGISKKVFSREQKNQLLTITGTLYYRAPEMFLGAGYDESVDIWAAGITLYELIMGKTPFQSEYISDTIENISKKKVNFESQIWSSYSSFVKDLINHLLVRNRSQRLTAGQARKHLWFKENLSSSIEGNLTHSDSFQLKLKRINASKQRNIDEKKQQPCMLKTSESPLQNIDIMKTKMQKWALDSDDDEVLIEITSDGQTPGI